MMPTIDWNHNSRRYRAHLRKINGPLAHSVACQHCDWSAFERKDGTGFAQISRLMSQGIGHIKSVHPEVIAAKESA